MEAATRPTLPGAERQAKREPEPPRSSPTAYQILELCEAKDGGKAWREVDEASTSAGDQRAIRISRDGHNGSYKAVPVRSWRGGLTLGQETQTVTVAKPYAD